MSDQVGAGRGQHPHQGALQLSGRRQQAPQGRHHPHEELLTAGGIDRLYARADNGAAKEVGAEGALHDGDGREVAGHVPEEAGGAVLWRRK